MDKTIYPLFCSGFLSAKNVHPVVKAVLESRFARLHPGTVVVVAQLCWMHLDFFHGSISSGYSEIWISPKESRNSPPITGKQLDLNLLEILVIQCVCSELGMLNPLYAYMAYLMGKMMTNHCCIDGCSFSQSKPYIMGMSLSIPGTKVSEFNKGSSCGRHFANQTRGISPQIKFLQEYNPFAISTQWHIAVGFQQVTFHLEMDVSERSHDHPKFQYIYIIVNIC